MLPRVAILRIRPQRLTINNATSVMNNSRFCSEEANEVLTENDEGH